MSQHISGSLITFLRALSLLLKVSFFPPLGPLRANFPHDSFPNYLLFLQTLCHHIFTASAISSEWVWSPYLNLKLHLVFLPAGHLCLNFLMSSATLVLITRIYFPKPVLHHVFPSFIAPTLSLPKKPINSVILDSFLSFSLQIWSPHFYWFYFSKVSFFSHSTVLYFLFFILFLISALLRDWQMKSWDD